VIVNVIILLILFNFIIVFIIPNLIFIIILIVALTVNYYGHNYTVTLTD